MNKLQRFLLGSCHVSPLCLHVLSIKNFVRKPIDLKAFSFNLIPRLSEMNCQKLYWPLALIQETS